MSAAVLRYEVPVDDQWHALRIEGKIVHVGSRKSGVVEFWTCPMDALTSDPDLIWQHPYGTSEFRVFGTGHPLDGGRYVGTTYDAMPALVWHLFARRSS